MFKSFRCRPALSVAFVGFLAGCGTTYTLPSITLETEARAARLFAAERAAPYSGRLSPSEALRRFEGVAAKVHPAAQDFCRQEARANGLDSCDVRLALNTRMPEKNAYFHYAASGQPEVVVSLALVQSTRNEDELAFVIGHEFGHLIGQHIEKQRQQQAAGALILGLATAYALSDVDTTEAHATIQQGLSVGYGLGGIAYSQAYELESDMIGARISEKAGYDPIKGAAYFARPEPAQSQSGTQLSFWGTHPPDRRRVATVIATSQQIYAERSLERNERRR